MKLNHLRPMLWTRQLKESIDFYTNILGFTCIEYNEDWGWATMHLDGVEIMLAIPNEHVPFDKPVFTGSLYINTDDVDYWWAQLKDKVKLCYDIENFEYDMREFAFYDINGYLIQYGQNIDGIED
ncbi:MAG: VOC family protein [Saprospiraceae bacterium]|uniref:VOC family protein n=1 Tax=Candidatus Opimibacter skivensis TaxID=2982028 RepID=A0A9D7XTZ7_9BACT|nr:VOC family protein [Candidatus Opimibacter skivensis]